jgi:UDP-N-acetylmuramyl pentapeptide phosphotransferase/UDP-N-acetylglucosamine-1-phosphate transferase
MGRILLIALAAVIFYQLVFKLIIPVVQLTIKMRRQVREFQNRMQQEQQRFQQPEHPHKEPSGSSNVGEYIDFEEIK